VRRGEIWLYEPKGSPRSRLVVLVSAQGVLDSTRRQLIAVDVRDRDPGDILAVSIATAGEEPAWVLGNDTSRVFRHWLAEQVGRLTAEELSRLDTMLRLALGLD